MALLVSMGACLAESTTNEIMHAYCGLLAHSWVQYIHLVGAKFKLSSTNTSRKVVVPKWYETLTCRVNLESIYHHQSAYG